MSQTKDHLRRHHHLLREAIMPERREELSREIEAAVLMLPEVRSAASVLAYHAVGSEVRTLGLIDALIAMGKTVALPRITDRRGRAMEAAAIDALTDVVAGHYDIPAPRDDAPVVAEPAVTLVPGLAFTEHGDRLGTGGGFYDRYLAAHPGTFAVALCFDEQLAESLPTSPHDKPVRCVVTPTRVLRR